MRFVVLIPARLASTRLPRKALADIGGVPMIVRTAQRAAASRAARVVVAADDDEIVAACSAHGVAALLTAKTHASGSDRIAEAAAALGLGDDEIVVNVQGDEPLIEPALIAACAALLGERPDCVMSTAAHAIVDADEFANPNVVKVVVDAAGRALYFSRAPIPHGYGPRVAPLLHVGVYAYRRQTLLELAAMPPLRSKKRSGSSSFGLCGMGFRFTLPWATIIRSASIRPRTCPGRAHAGRKGGRSR